jgi:hypothetical protein
MTNLSKKQSIIFSKLWAKKFQEKHKESKAEFKKWLEK